MTTPTFHTYKIEIRTNHWGATQLMKLISAWQMRGRPERALIKFERRPD